MPRRREPNPYAIEVGQRIAQLRDEASLTVEALADRCGMGKGHLSNIVRGLTVITITTAKRIARGLGLPPAALFVTPARAPREQLIDIICHLSEEECKEWLVWLKQRKRTERPGSAPAAH